MGITPEAGQPMNITPRVGSGPAGTLEAGGRT